MPLDYLCCFVVVLRGIHRKFEIWQTGYILLFWSHTPKYNIQAKESLAKVKEKWSAINFDVFDLYFILFVPTSQTMNVINRNGTCCFLHASDYWHMCWCVCWHVRMRSHVSNGENWCIAQDFTVLTKISSEGGVKFKIV